MQERGVERRGYLGVGWKFPIQVTPGGRIALSSYEKRIEESIYIILGTAKGERVMLSDFGAGIHELVFAPGSPGTASAVEREVRRALVQYEPRIDVLDVIAQQAPEEPNLLLIRIGYRIRANNSLANVVYPFYLSEGA